jgi:predicted ATPase
VLTTPRRVAPIKRWGLRRFKSVESADLDLSPLTVIVGANSSGKSTVLQSILLLAQAAQEWRGSASAGYRLNGPLVELGSFESIKTFFAPEQDFVIRAELSLEADPGRADIRYRLARERLSAWAIEEARRRPRTIAWEISFSGHPEREPGSTIWREIRFDVPAATDDEEKLELFASRLDGPFPDQAAVERGDLIRTSGYWSAEARWIGQDPRTGGGGFEPCTGYIRFGAAETPIFGLSAPAGLPTAVLVEADFHERLASMWADEFLGLTHRYESPSRRDSRRGPEEELTKAIELAARRMEEIAGIAAFDLLDWIKDPKQVPLRALLRKSVQQAAERPDSRRLSSVIHGGELGRQIALTMGSGPRTLLPQPLAARADLAGAAMRFLEGHVTYLGPLRQEPRIVYQSAPSARPLFLGTRGEYTAAVLHQRQNEQISAPWPDEDVRQARLIEFVGAWMSKIVGVAAVSTEDQGRLGLEVAYRPRALDRSVDPTMLGVGVSQVLPVVATCLLWQPGDTILLEQPELHLHPAAQQALGEFFLACAASGRQLVVETHSEYIVTRLRRKIAEDLTDDNLNLVGFINATQRDGRTFFDPVQTTRLGALAEWPEGFFDQSASDAEELMRAAYRKQTDKALD